MEQNADPDTDMDGVDFSELPDVAWVKILNLLPLNDRFRVSETCHRLNAIVNHPTLWSVHTVQFWGATDAWPKRNRAQEVAIDYSQAQLIKRFGKYFQHLKFVVHGHLRDMGQKTIDVISTIAEECRLETLTIYAGPLTSVIYTVYGSPPKHSAVATFLSIVKNARRMKHLNVRSWPMYENVDTPEFNIFGAIADNPKLREGLESLILFGIDDEQWSEREPMLPSVAVTQEVISALRNLSLVGLRSPMLSEDLLQVFADPERAKLTTLQIFIHYQPGSSSFKIPHIGSQVWKALVSRNPKLRVQCTVLFSVPDWELASMLAPEVPVSSFKVLRYAKLDPSTLSRLHTHHCKTLTQFMCYSDAQCQDEDIKKLVTRCPFLVEFVYHGQIYSETVVAIAKHKGINWKRFEVKAEHVKVKNEFSEVDEDEVISRGPDGELVLVGLMRFHQPEETRLATIEQMTSDVSKALGVPWDPL